MVTCGSCVCPTVTPTLPVGDLCTVINKTHAVCSIGINTHGMSVGNSMFTGMVIGIAGILFLFVIYKLFYDEEYKTPRRNK